MALALVEHKTYSGDITPDSPYWRRITTIDPQITMYLDGVRSLGLDCDRVLYDVLRVPAQLPGLSALRDPDGLKVVLDEKGERVRSRDGKKWRQTGDAKAGLIVQSRPETPEEYGKRVLAAIAADPDRYYQRAVIVRLRSEVDEGRHDVWATARSIHEARRLRMYPRNPDSCMTYKRECDYMRVCVGEADIRDPVLFVQSDDPHEELSPSGDLDERSRLTQSALRCFRSCARKYQFRYVFGIRPLRKSEPLRRGTSLHNALNEWMSTGGNIHAAMAKLDRDDPFALARERAMMMGYHARWDKPPRVVAVEKEWETDLVHPVTGERSKSYKLAGKADAIVDLTSVREQVEPSLAPMLEASLRDVERKGV